MRLRFSLLGIAVLVCSRPTSAQFQDEFSGGSLSDWTYFTGDGTATMEFVPRDGFASIRVDATSDKRNIWWALIKRDVAPALDLRRLRQPNQELRISACVRASHAPRRVNLHLNTQKTTDFHTHLMEFDIPTAGEWHAISYTTRDFEAEPGDTVNGQLALMDWGLGKYEVDIDDFRVDVIDVVKARPDQGEQVPYHPPIPPLDSFPEHSDVAQGAMVDFAYPEMNFAGWAAGKTPVLSVGGTRRVILRWDLSKIAGRKVAGAGLLELTTHSLERGAPQKDFGMIRVAEILGGNARWERQFVTLASLMGDELLEEVFNPQMIIDVPVAEKCGGRTFITINAPVLQRLLDGRTRGLVVLPLGAIHAAFRASDLPCGECGPRLHFRLLPKPDSSEK